MGGPGSGGPREGSPGNDYSNRTDLQIPPSRYYGQGVELAAQAAPAPSVQPAPSSTPQAPITPPGPLHRPTERPNEPVTMAPPMAGSLSAVFEQAGRASGSPDLLALAERARALGQ